MQDSFKEENVTFFYVNERHNICVVFVVSHHGLNVKETLSPPRTLEYANEMFDGPFLSLQQSVTLTCPLKTLQ